MLTVAYLANQFPAAVEPYVIEEIGALRQLGVRVISGSVARVKPMGGYSPEIVLRPVQATVLMRALWLCTSRWRRISKLVARILCRGHEGPVRRAKALGHTLLGACYAVRLEGREVEHIHVHHGFSASWIAMVAARLLDIDFSMTLHGSDLLLHRTYLDLKLRYCSFCLTVSEFNRRFITTEYPEIEPTKVIVARLGVEVSDAEASKMGAPIKDRPFRMLAVGRLHAVKDHAFLVRACAQLQAQSLDFQCEIAGNGPERRRLESLIRKLGVAERVRLLGHTPPDETDSLYRLADLVVLTSRSEGIPLVLMEAMARGRLVLAPAITGIPELVIAGKTGFLYQPGSMADFLEKAEEIYRLLRQTGASTASTNGFVQRLDWIRHAACLQISHNFNRTKYLQVFTELFLQRVSRLKSKEIPYASSVLQQI